MRTNALAHPVLVAGLITVVVAIVAAVVFVFAREARRPWPPRRDEDGNRIVEAEVKEEKSTQGTRRMPASAAAYIHPTPASGSPPSSDAASYAPSFSSISITTNDSSCADKYSLASRPPSVTSVPLFTRTSPPASPTRARTPRTLSSTRGPASTLHISISTVGASGLRPLSLVSSVSRGGTAHSQASSAFTGVPTTALDAIAFAGRVV